MRNKENFHETKRTFATRVVVLELDDFKIGVIDVHTGTIGEQEMVVHAAFSFLGIGNISKLDESFPNFEFIKDENLCKRHVS